MNELPCIGCGITIVDPGPLKSKKSSWRDRPRRKMDGTIWLMRCLVERVESEPSRSMVHWSPIIHWRAGVRYGQVLLENEGVTWVRGHGPEARASLIAARKLAGLR